MPHLIRRRRSCTSQRQPTRHQHHCPSTSQHATHIHDQPLETRRTAAVVDTATDVFDQSALGDGTSQRAKALQPPKATETRHIQD
jgi:hypothetical protein